jgi:serine/threonine protein kinase
MGESRSGDYNCAQPMPLTAGTRIGPYEIELLLGTGGMGEVYRARDPRLDRTVAIKVIPQQFAQDARRMGRFQREAQVLASLNHPNIATIYGLEESETRALVMELVEGPTLADRIREGAIPIEEALPIAKEIAEALEYAHEQGIIHRDLKPANVKLTRDGKVSLRMFGSVRSVVVLMV